MIKKVEVEFKPSGEELANELWEMDCRQQAEFLYELSRTKRITPSLFLIQLQYVADEINDSADVYNKASIVRMLEIILEYIKEGEDMSAEKSNTPEFEWICPECGGKEYDANSLCLECGCRMISREVTENEQTPD